MYAIFQMGGFQYRAEEGEVVRVPLQAAKQGDKLEIGDVLLIQNNDAAMIGTPFVQGAKITAEVLGESKGDKVMTFKYKRRTKYRRTMGHRQQYLDIKINRIQGPQS